MNSPPKIPFFASFIRRFSILFGKLKGPYKDLGNLGKRILSVNSLLYGLPKSQILTLQRIQDDAARLAMNIGKHSYVTPALRSSLAASSRSYSL